MGAEFEDAALWALRATVEPDPAATLGLFDEHFIRHRAWPLLEACRDGTLPEAGALAALCAGQWGQYLSRSERLVSLLTPIAERFIGLLATRLAEGIRCPDHGGASRLGIPDW